MQTVRTTSAGPSVGKEAAPIGTPEWADRVRLTVGVLVADLADEAARIGRYFVIMIQHRAWTLLKKADGTAFETIEELCATARPWGFGRPWPEIRHHIAKALTADGVDAERVLALATVPKAQDPKAGPGRGHVAESVAKKTNPHREGTFSVATTERLRAINRAPEPVREAYKQGRIGQALAAKLGPKNPKPEQAARVAEAVIALASVKDRKAVESVVREKLAAPSAGPVDRLKGPIRKLSHSDLYVLRAWVDALMYERKAFQQTKKGASKC